MKPYNTIQFMQTVFVLRKVYVILFLFFGLPVQQVFGQQISEAVANHLQESAAVNLENIRLSVDFHNILLDDAILMLGEKSGVSINYNGRLFSAEKAVTYSGENVTMAEVLNNILPKNISHYTVQDIVILQKIEREAVQPVRTIYGIVSDRDGNPMPGANILIMGTNIGTVANLDGYYEINVSDGGATLIFSMIGFEAREVNTRTLEQDELNIVLLEQRVGLEEVVVLGYSEVQAQHVASSVSMIDMDRVKSGPVGKLQEVFRGTLPGVNLMQGTNLPGSVPGTIQIRGISTLENASPLVIVDGMEQTLTDIDPNQVRSITVLKDAASASMYGSRGANGVILIETERGMSDRFSVNVHTWTAMHEPIDLPDFVNAADFMMLRNEARSIQGQSLQYTQQEIDAARAGQSANTDWLDTIMQRQAYSHNTSANISGGGGVGTFNLMIGYNQEGGLNPYEGTNKFTTRFNTNINIADRFVLLADFYAHRLQVDRLYANTDGHGLYQTAWRMNPTQSVFYDSSLENHYILHNNMNPLAAINHGGIRNNMYNRSTINLRPRFNVNENLHISGNISYMINQSANKHERRNFRFFDAEGVPVQVWNNQVGSELHDSENQLTARALVQYVTELRQGKDNIYITGGSEVMNHTYTNYQEIAKASFFGKLNYSFDNRYIFEVTARTDGSSKFAPGHRWGFFPSGAVAWNAHNEGFMSGLTERGILNELKFRVSYGLIGNENVDPYLWEEVVDNWGWTIRVPNPGFSWEKQRQGNIGVDLSTLDNRLNMTFEAYDKYSYDLIYDQFTVPPLTGSNSLESAVNIGEVENRGWELSADWSDNIGDFSYRVGGMVFDNKNKMLQAGYTASDTLIFKGDTDRVWYRGIPINNYYGFETDGYFQNQAEIDATDAKLPNTLPGDIRYVDQNGDGIINDQDRVYLGDPLPRYNYAVNINLWYKRWDFTLVGQGIGRRTGRLNGHEGFPVYVDGGSNDLGAPRQYYMDNRWTPDNQDSRFPRVWTGTSPNTMLSDVWLSDASFFRIRTLELGYTFPNIGQNLRNVRIYFNGQDLFTFTNWEGLEPERNGGNGYYPRMARFSMGIRASIY